MANNDNANGGYNPKMLGGTLGKQLTSYATDKSDLYKGMGTTTRNALDNMLAGSNPAGYSTYMDSAIGDIGSVAAGQRFGEADPGYATLRKNVANDAMTSSLNAFNNSGLFGSDSNQVKTGEGVANALAGLDYGNFQNDQQRQERAIGMLPGMRDASLAPARTQLEVGAAEDADASAVRTAGYNRLLETLGAFNGSQQSAGMKEEVPLWQQLLGYVAGNAGNAIKAF